MGEGVGWRVVFIHLPACGHFRRDMPSALADKRRAAFSTEWLVFLRQAAGTYQVQGFGGLSISINTIKGGHDRKHPVNPS